MLKYAALLDNIGQYLSLKFHDKSSHYILKGADPPRFTDEVETIEQPGRSLLSQVPSQNKIQKIRRFSNNNRKQSGYSRASYYKSLLDLIEHKNITRLSCQLLGNKIEIT